MRSLSPLLGGLVLSLASSACAPLVAYTPVDARVVRAPTNPDDVEVYPREEPEWDYVLAGEFQEMSRDSVAGGRRELAVLLRELGAEEGCDAVIVGGNVSRFEGMYIAEGRGRWRWPDGSLQGASSRRMVRLMGTNARCVVRKTPIEPWAHVLRIVPPVPNAFYSF